jgi:ABC-2 type transport system ATP-binding protein
MIKTEGLYKKFNVDWVVENLNLDIKKGEFYCLLGPNGAGKTTTLKLIAGLLAPDKGKIVAAGFDCQTQALAAKGKMGFLPDEPFMYDNLTGREFAEFAGRIYGLSPDQSFKRQKEYFEMFELDYARDTLVRDYSHGMRQKLVYITNLIHEPEVFLIDEPLVGLDPKGIRLVKDLLRAKADAGMTILMSTHLLDIAGELADRIGVLQKGRMVAEGTLSGLRQNIKGGTLEEIFLEVTGK